MFGFAGASRTGKTTLAKAVAEAYGFHFHLSNVSGLMKARGFDMVSPALSLERRIEAQELLLSAYVAELEAAPRPFVTDRTPIDMIAYLVAEIGMHSGLTPELDGRVERYVARCYDVTEMFFHTIVGVRPFGAYETDPTKPPPIVSYQWHTQMLIESALVPLSARSTDFMILQELDLASRVARSCDIVKEVLIENAEARKRARLH